MGGTCSATLIVKEEEARDWKAQLKKMSFDCRGGVGGGRLERKWGGCQRGICMCVLVGIGVYLYVSTDV